MDMTFDREERRQQKAILQKAFPDYEAHLHDFFVIRFNRESDAQLIREAQEILGIIPSAKEAMS